jgi:hypothetical protein
MSDDLLALAGRLAKASPTRPRQADLQRAVSTAYYALFRAVARNAADCFVGTVRANRPDRAWGQVFRALEHGFAKSACEVARNMTFPQDIKDCADAFADLQKARHDADYDPHHRLTRTDAIEAVEKAREAIAALRRAPVNDRRAFGPCVDEEETVAFCGLSCGHRLPACWRRRERRAEWRVPRTCRDRPRCRGRPCRERSACTAALTLSRSTNQKSSPAFSRASWREKLSRSSDRPGLSTDCPATWTDHAAAIQKCSLSLA